MTADTLFIQFFSPSKSGYYDLCNGFSDTYDLCRGKGDFLWLEHEPDAAKWYDASIYKNRPLPITTGTVYLSAVYLNHLYQACVWAQEYPDINFVVGGPVAAEKRSGAAGWDSLYFQIDPGLFPSNFKVTGMSVEDWFGAPNFSGRWKLDVPEQVPAQSPIYFSYTLDNGCYWSKCLYCNIALHAAEHFRERKDFRFEFAAIQHRGRRIVRLNTGSVTPRHIKNLLPAVPRGDRIEYRFFMRPAKGENRALQDVLRRMKGSPPVLTIGIGIEFPSRRMLSYMGKGFGPQDILDCLKICFDHGVRVNGNVMLGWNNLTAEDISEFERFMSRIPERSMSTVQLRWLFAHPYTTIHELYQGADIKLGPFYVGFHAELDENAVQLNKSAARILTEYGAIKHFKVEGLQRVRENWQKS